MKTFNSLSDLAFLKETMEDNVKKTNECNVAISVSKNTSKHVTKYYIDPYTKMLVTQTI